MKATNRNISVGCVVAQVQGQTLRVVNEMTFITVFVSTTNDISNDLNNAISVVYGDVPSSTILYQLQDSFPRKRRRLEVTSISEKDHCLVIFTRRIFEDFPWQPNFKLKRPKKKSHSKR